MTLLCHGFYPPRGLWEHQQLSVSLCEVLIGHASIGRQHHGLTCLGKIEVIFGDSHLNTQPNHGLLPFCGAPRQRRSRTLVRQDPRAPGRTRRLGPYYQWTRKIAGRTVNVNLSPAQAKVFGRAIAQHRRLEAMLDRMRELSLKMLEASTKGVKKRKSRKNNDEALS